MKVTKFEQSCLLLEQDKTRILIDPGFPFADKHDITELGKLDAVFITHEHTDHFDQKICEGLADKTKVYVNKSTAKQFDGAKKMVVENRDLIEAGTFKIKVIELAHSLMPDGSKGPQNVGYLINDIFFHPGDGSELEGLSVENIALPITGPDISMKRAFQFARQVSAKKAIAIHYDVFGANADLYAKFTKRFNQPFSLKVLNPGQSMEL
jgi:L-ascorbate metabolism protein UlaG (beta-lactamase superfamily)